MLEYTIVKRPVVIQVIKKYMSAKTQRQTENNNPNGPAEGSSSLSQNSGYISMLKNENMLLFAEDLVSGRGKR